MLSSQCIPTFEGSPHSTMSMPLCPKGKVLHSRDGSGEGVQLRLVVEQSVNSHISRKPHSKPLCPKAKVLRARDASGQVL